MAQAEEEDKEDEEPTVETIMFLHVTMLEFSVQTHDWQGGSFASWAGRFSHAQRISSTRSVFAVTPTPI